MGRCNLFETDAPAMSVACLVAVVCVVVVAGAIVLSTQMLGSDILNETSNVFYPYVIAHFDDCARDQIISDRILAEGIKDRFEEVLLNDVAMVKFVTD